MAMLRCSGSATARCGRRGFASIAYPAKVKLVEVGPRDGLQSEQLPVKTEDKIKLVNMLSKTGLPVVEATAFVSKKMVPQMADAEEVYAGIEKQPGLSYPVLTPTLRQFDRALECGVKEVAVFTAVSETFTARNIGSTIEESFDRFRPLVAKALDEGVRVRGYVSCVAGCPYEGTVAIEKCADVSQKLFDMGCYEISLGDTIGIGNPGQIAQLIRAVGARVGHDNLAAHFHDTYGQALSNILVALQEGVATVDSAVAGLGGCPYAKGASGNVATEEVVYMLAGLGVETGVNLEKVIEAGSFISGVLGRETMSRVASSIVRRRSVTVPVRYFEVLQAALVDGAIDPSERNFLAQHRLRHKVSDEEHAMALKELGWTESDYLRGSPKETAALPSHYFEQMQHVLSDGVVSSRERHNLEQYRVVYHVSEQEHEAALNKLGWSKPEYERGIRIGLAAKWEGQDLQSAM